MGIMTHDIERLVRMIEKAGRFNIESTKK